MADCFYHGYSGAPGPCPECQEADRRGVDPEQVKAQWDAKFTQAELNVMTENQITGKRRTLADAYPPEKEGKETMSLRSELRATVHSARLERATDLEQSVKQLVDEQLEQALRSIGRTMREIAHKGIEQVGLRMDDYFTVTGFMGDRHTLLERVAVVVAERLQKDELQCTVRDHDVLVSWGNDPPKLPEPDRSLPQI